MVWWHFVATFMVKHSNIFRLVPFIVGGLYIPIHQVIDEMSSYRAITLKTQFSLQLTLKIKDHTWIVMHNQKNYSQKLIGSITDLCRSFQLFICFIFKMKSCCIYINFHCNLKEERITALITRGTNLPKNSNRAVTISTSQLCVQTDVAYK